MSRPAAPSRRSLLLATAAAGAALGLAASPATAVSRPFGRYGSPRARRTPATLYVDPHGRGDFTSVQAAVTAATGPGWTLVLAPGTYRETVTLDSTRTGTTWIGAAEDPRATVIVYDNAAGTPRPDGSGTHGTSGSATTTVAADGFTAHRITFANDWLRADHPEYTGTQAVAIKVQGDRCAFHHCRFLGHQDTLYADTRDLTHLARQYYAHCYAEGDVDFVFGRATAVYDHCHFRTLVRTDLAAPPYGFVFAPSTAAANPRGYLVTDSRISSEAPDGFYKLARPWVPSSDPTARPMLTVRGTRLGAGLDAVAPYANMRDAHPWQEQRFREYRNTGPGAAVTVPANRPQLTRAEAAVHTRAAHLGDWRPYARP
ncbi:pectinesterase family protein [Streptomyces griseoviridis]|uniref:Pectinesterase n=3 Tax=Streptomyces TaxID=1883 RepID=A0ABT9LBG9_STRGD|nr:MULTISPECIES: pectinesterase family protein [Streptomyces]MDP9681069.1 pectinesterase [Streptomyces griseoviridis]GGS57588.1 pectinesterase [Streptomyces niveoruber]GGT10244.1 pectinesterase [Streptomyces griseoviridis]GGU53706.1 pectinesterase [Streptomyces daghestanicus]GHI28390.1 pectinesterase [Streptomyces daghestanicus]